MTEYQGQQLWLLDDARRQVNSAAENLAETKRRMEEEATKMEAELQRQPELAAAGPGDIFSFWSLILFSVVPIFLDAAFTFAVILPYGKELGYGIKTVGLAGVVCGLVVTALCVAISIQRITTNPDLPKSGLVETLKSREEYQMWQFAALSFGLLIMGTVGYAVQRHVGVAAGVLLAVLYGIVHAVILFGGRATYQARAYVVLRARLKMYEFRVRHNRGLCSRYKEEFMNLVQVCVHRYDDLLPMIGHGRMSTRVPFSATATTLMTEVFPERSEHLAIQGQPIEEANIVAPESSALTEAS